MKWFKDALTKIYQPYDVRGLYNQHKLLVLDTELYEDVLNRLNELKIIHRGSSLDMNTIEGIQEDIEADKANLDRIRKEREHKASILSSQVENEVSDQRGYVRKDKKIDWRHEVYKSHGDVAVIFEDTIENLLVKAEREAIAKVMQSGVTHVKAARMLGISYRTLTNKLKKYFKDRQAVPN